MELEILVFGLLIVIIIIFLVLAFIPIPFTSINTQIEGPYDISKINNIFDSQTFQTNSSATFQGFFYIDALQKTGITTPCSSDATDPSLPECNTGRYALCSCNTTDCSPCDHIGYVPLINLNNVVILEILGSPDSSRQNKAGIQLTMKTQSSALIEDASQHTVNPSLHPVVSQLYIETFVLPPIPYQKWIMITISREGRRFDIYYNDTLVLSKTTSTNIYREITNTNISVGNTVISGSSGFFSLYTTIQSATNIASQYNSFINTRGTPLFNSPPPTLMNLPNSLDRLPSSIGVPNIPSICSSGNCINNPTSPPAKPYYEWSSSYA